MNRLKVILATLVLIITGVNGFFYWQQVDDLNGVIAEVNLLDAALASFETSASTLGDIDGLKGAINSLKTELSDIEVELADLVIPSDAPVNIVPQVAPSVVRIEVAIPPNRTPGSGIIITEGGYIITNFHVIEGNSTAQVTLAAGDTYTATVISEDPQLDLAILEINSQRTDFPRATLGRNEDITTGEKVIALGYPYSGDLGRELAATDGIVSALKFIDGYEYIQTDAEISLGYGGGPLVNLSGEVIGMVTWAFTAGEGLNFAIPVNNMVSLIEDSIGAID